MSFAAIQARANASIAKLLATDEATLDYLPIKGKFDRAYGEALGLGTSHPRFLALTADMPEVTQDSLLRVGDDSFSIRSVEPDGTGWTALTLQAAL